MKISYQNAPLPGEHNNGEIWVKWRLEVGDSRLSGWAPTREKAEEAVDKQVKEYAKCFDWMTFAKLHSAVEHDKRSAQT